MATIQTPKSMAILVHIVTICITTVTGMYDYAVQVEPVTFIEEPQSQLTKQGQSLILSCQIRLTPPVSNQPIPTIDWLKDSFPITSEDHDITINTNVSVGFSELIIPVINTGLSGSYQCIANDADKRYSTISKKAVITVLSKTNTTLIEAELGQPLLLNCSTVTAIGYATHIWLHNDTPVIDETILSSGSVFILNVNYNHQGVWQCHTSYSINIIPSLTTDLTNAIAFLDADIRNISYNESLDVHCQLVGLPPDVIIDTVTWHQVSSSNSHTMLLRLDEIVGSGSINDLDMVMFDYLIPKFEENSNGHYYCSIGLITNNETVTIQSYGLDILITGSPVITTPKVVDIFLEYDATHLELLCSYEPGIPLSIYWTRNGKYIDVTNTYDMSTGLLRLSKPENFDNLFGTYQCFVENIHGTDYTINRILVKYLSNPPGNLNIRALTNITNFFKPYLNITWTSPLQRGNVEELSYSITVADTLDSNTSPVFIITDPSSTISSIEIELSMDSAYVVVMTVYRPNIQGLSALCVVDTIARFYTVSKPFDYLICTDDGRVLIKWTPLGSNPLLYPTESVTINGACVHEGKVMEFHYLMTTLYNVYEAEPFSELLPGTVCEFYGQYQYGIIPLNVCGTGNDFAKLTQTYLEIPRIICQVQEDVSLIAKEDSVTLSLVCGNDQIQILWNISIDILCKLNGSDANVLVSGICVNGEEVFNFNNSIDLMRKPTGFLIYNNVTTDSICSIDVNISNVNYVISSGQCILDQSNIHHTFKYDNSIQNQTIDCSSNRLTMPGYSTIIYFPSETSTPLRGSSDILVIESDSGPSYGIVGIIVAVCIVLLVAITVFLAVLILFLYKRNIKTSWNVNEFEIHEKIESVTNEDVCSIKTVVDPLYEEDTELNVYKGYTIETTNCKPDTTGSSGYGSELMTIIGDYHSEKLNEVEDMNIQSEMESDISQECLLNNHFPDRTKDNFIMCVYCSTIGYKRTGSVNDLNRLCPCVGSEGYVRLAGINRAELVNHRDKMINSRERLNTRLSTLSV